MILQITTSPQLHKQHRSLFSVHSCSCMMLSIPLSHPVPPTTTTTQSPTETVMEGGNLTLTCTSEGTPTPTFTWRLNGEDIPSNRHTDTSIAPVVDFDRQAGTVTSVANGMTTSVLTISVAVFPGDDGVYECIGTNSRAGMDNSCSAFIQLSVQGIAICTISISSYIIGGLLTVEGWMKIT